MQTIHSLLVYTHIAIGSIALILFWAPIFATKGGRTHVRIGRIYVLVMYVVVVTAFLASSLVLFDPLSVQPAANEQSEEAAQRFVDRSRNFSLFLLMLSVLVFTSLQHGIRAVRARQDAGVLAEPLHLATIASLFVLAVIVGAIGLSLQFILLIVFAGIGIAGSIGMYRDTRRDLTQRKERIAAHLNALIGTGIGAYTAFFAVGGSRLLGELLPGQLQVIPWILPSIIGSIAIQRLMRHYRPRQPAQIAEEAGSR